MTFFFNKFPTVYDLAVAPTEEIERIIGNLGLKYRSARLRKTAIELVKNYNGHVPKEKEKLMSLPGVGSYIANALLCIGFRENVPMVDTNFTFKIFIKVFNECCLIFIINHEFIFFHRTFTSTIPYSHFDLFLAR